MEKKLTRREFIKQGFIVSLGVTGFSLSNACKAKAKQIKTKKIIEISKIKNNELFKFAFKGEKGVLIKHNDKFYAYKDSCVHRGGPMKNIQDDRLVCAWHGAKYEPDTGKHVSGPGSGTLEKIDITIKNGAVYII
jgi:nitrite reductase/ring-hydroxylating ferredoxin subunit